MNQDFIHQLFAHKYNPHDWKQFLTYIFPQAGFTEIPQPLPIDNTLAKNAFYLGNILLNENSIDRKIAVFEVELAQNIHIERNRVGLRNLLRKYWKNIDAAFMVFYHPQSLKWRFSYVSELTGFDADGNYQIIQTEPKRFTYVLGEGESVKTATERFLLLAKKGDTATLEDIKEAFSVEKLSKAFFDEYKKHYNSFCDFMMQTPGIKSTIFNGDEKAIRDFNKKLLGRIVFLYFLQKKGWLGVPMGTNWGHGDLNFLSNLFNQHKNPDLFYSEILSRLFFDTLNTQRKDDITELIKGHPCRIPYLNGGLFEEEDIKQRNLIIDGKLFENLFKFFNQYNFTIYEDDPNDHTVAVDPEMLGHIFENLLEDNKDKGAFYTPKEIVHYMCQESLVEYLCTYLSNQNTHENDYRPFIENWIKYKRIENDKIFPFIEKLNKALDEVKICDPAIGSGAFPMGLLQEIFSAKQTLWLLEKGNLNDFPASEIKLNIIQNSIYGVDIEKGAVDIARLRFWLSLVVDEDEPKPLPNLDYKIVVGNSLVSKLNETVIDIDWKINETAHGLFGADLAKKQSILLKNISQKQKEFFYPNSDKKKLAAEIRNLKIDLLINQLELMVKTQGIEEPPQKNNYKKSMEFTQATERYLQTQEWKNNIEQLQKLKDIPHKPLNFFDWKLDFPEVLNELINPNPGFDIVIGNPPYINVEKIDNVIKSNIKNFKTAYQKYDIYVLFYEKGLALTKENGQLIYITSNKFLSQGYGFLLRKELLKYKINQIINFNFDIFASATVRTCIFHLQKTNLTQNNIKIIDIATQKDAHKFNQLEYKYLNQNVFHNTEENNFRINLTNEKIKILEKIKQNCIKIEDIFSVSYGLRPVPIDKSLGKEIFIKFNYNKNYKIYFEGKDMGNWRIKTTSYIDYKPELMYNPMFPELFENKKLAGLCTLSEIEKLRFVYDETGAYTNHSVAILTLWYLLSGAQNQTVLRNISKERIHNSKKFDYFFVQGILNSKLIKFYVNELLYDGTHFYPNHMKSLPIKNVEQPKQKPIIDLVEQIHKILKGNKETNVVFLEQQIDIMVYKLYELTHEEVKIIDPLFSLSKEEYEGFQ